MGEELDLAGLEAKRVAVYDAASEFDYFETLARSAPALFAAARERDDLKAWAFGLHLGQLQQASVFPFSPTVNPIPGHSVTEWAAEEIAALRALLAEARESLDGPKNP